MADKDTSYIDYETFLSPTFSASSFANTLVLSTNNFSDTSLDLSTPLSKTLFDLQEVDTHIHSLTTKSALPLLSHTQGQTAASNRILDALSTQIATLSANYSRLESEVGARHAAAEQVRLAAARLWVTLKIGRAVTRALQLGRQLEAQTAELRPSLTATRSRGEDHRSLLSAVGTLLALRALFAADAPGSEGEHLGRIAVVNTLRHDLVEPSEQRLRAKAQQIVREFSLASIPGQAQSASTPADGSRDARSRSPSASQATTGPVGASTYAQTSETKARTTAALTALYLLSPVPTAKSGREFAPTLLLTALQTYLQTALTSSAASLSRALAQLPTLPRALQEVTARCRNVVALESLLQGIEVPEHPMLLVSKEDPGVVNGTDGAEGKTGGEEGEDEDDEREGVAAKENLLTPLLEALDTASVPSFFWRTLAAGMGSKVGDILTRGGAPARSLRSQKDRVRESIREAVLRGCEGARLPEGRGSDNAWEREAAVMVASVVGPLGR